MKFSEMINEILEDIVKDDDEEENSKDDKKKIEKECNKFLRSKL
jgi:hypothetical protein